MSCFTKLQLFWLEFVPYLSAWVNSAIQIPAHCFKEIIIAFFLSFLFEAEGGARNHVALKLAYLKDRAVWGDLSKTQTVANK